MSLRNDQILITGRRSHGLVLVITAATGRRSNGAVERDGLGGLVHSGVRSITTTAHTCGLQYMQATGVIPLDHYIVIGNFKSGHGQSAICGISTITNIAIVHVDELQRFCVAASNHNAVALLQIDRTAAEIIIIVTIRMVVTKHIDNVQACFTGIVHCAEVVYSAVIVVTGRLMQRLVGNNKDRLGITILNLGVQIALQTTCVAVKVIVVNGIDTVVVGVMGACGGKQTIAGSQSAHALTVMVALNKDSIVRGDIGINTGNNAIYVYDIVGSGIAGRIVAAHQDAMNSGIIFLNLVHEIGHDGAGIACLIVRTGDNDHAVSVVIIITRNIGFIGSGGAAFTAYNLFKEVYAGCSIRLGELTPTISENIGIGRTAFMLQLAAFIRPASIGILLFGENSDIALIGIQIIVTVGQVKHFTKAVLGVSSCCPDDIRSVSLDLAGRNSDRSGTHVSTSAGTAGILQRICIAGVCANDQVFFTRSQFVNELVSGTGLVVTTIFTATLAALVFRIVNMSSIANTVELYSASVVGAADRDDFAMVSYSTSAIILILELISTAAVDIAPGAISFVLQINIAVVCTGTINGSQVLFCLNTIDIELVIQDSNRPDHIGFNTAGYLTIGKGDLLSLKAIIIGSAPTISFTIFSSFGSDTIVIAYNDDIVTSSQISYGFISITSVRFVKFILVACVIVGGAVTYS